MSKNILDPNKKLYPKRLFSHALPRRLLPKGGRVKLLHLAKHKITNVARNYYCKQHVYTTNKHWIDNLHECTVDRLHSQMRGVSSFKVDH